MADSSGSSSGNAGRNNKNVRARRHDNPASPPQMPPALHIDGMPPPPLPPPLHAPAPFNPFPRMPPALHIYGMPPPPLPPPLHAPAPFNPFPQMPPAPHIDGMPPPPLPHPPHAPAPPLPPIPYLQLPGFPQYPLGNEENIQPLFRKSLSNTDINANLVLTGGNIPSFVQDVRSKIGLGDAHNGYNIQLVMVEGNLPVADAESRLRLGALGARGFLVWHDFLDHHAVHLNPGQRVCGWCEWVRVNNTDTLRIIIKLDDE